METKAGVYCYYTLFSRHPFKNSIYAFVFNNDTLIIAGVGKEGVFILSRTLWRENPATVGLGGEGKL
jgi:hypothetical protein